MTLQYKIKDYIEEKRSMNRNSFPIRKFLLSKKSKRFRSLKSKSHSNVEIQGVKKWLPLRVPPVKLDFEQEYALRFDTIKSKPSFSNTRAAFGFLSKIKNIFTFFKRKNDYLSPIPMESSIITSPSKLMHFSNKKKLTVIKRRDKKKKTFLEEEKKIMTLKSIANYNEETNENTAMNLEKIMIDFRDEEESDYQDRPGESKAESKEKENESIELEYLNELVNKT